MDNVTHTLTGFALSRAGFVRSQKGQLAAFIVASNLPDIDIVTALGGDTAYLSNHRGLTHSVLGVAVLSLLLALVLRVLFRESSFLGFLLAGFLGCGTHVFMDLWTSYGTRILAPFRADWYTLDFVFIIDPLVLVLLGYCLFRTGRQAARMSLALVLAYVAARGVLHGRAMGVLEKALPEGQLVRAVVIPSPVSPFKWRAVADCGSAYFVGDVNALGGTASLTRRQKAPESPAVVAARQTESAAVFLDFSRFPWLEVQQVGDETDVVWTDLRFWVPGRRRSFAEEVHVGHDGRILSQGFHF